MGYTTNIGKQEVSIFPFQDLTSVYGNIILYGLFEPGVYNGTLSVQNKDSTSFNIIISAGTTMIFKRTDTNGALFVGKVVLTEDGVIEMIKGTCWRDNTILKNSPRLYIVADWGYDITKQNEKYAGFSIKAESEIDGIKALGATSHKLILGSLLNQAFFLNQPDTANVSNYHVAYDEQSNRNMMKRLKEKNDIFNIDFSSSGRGVKVLLGSSLVSDTFINLASATSYLVPPVAINNYVSNKATNTVINVTSPSTESNYYQVDFLRVVMDEQTGTAGVRWESFLKPKVQELDFTYSSQLTQTQLIDEIKNTEFDITDEGYTLLISIRPRVLIPSTDGSTNTIWPDHCILMADTAVTQNGSPEKFSRLKVPVYTLSDIG